MRVSAGEYKEKLKNKELSKPFFESMRVSAGEYKEKLKKKNFLNRVSNLCAQALENTKKS